MNHRLGPTELSILNATQQQSVSLSSDAGERVGRQLIERLGELSEDTQLQVVICVVSSHDQETKELEKLLRILNEQYFPAHAMEIFIFCNWREGSEPDDCIKIAQRYARMRDNVCVVAESVPKEFTIGEIRSVIFDAVSWRAQQAGVSIPIVNLDCDTPWMNPYALGGFNSMLRQSSAGVCVGELHWTSKIPEIIVGASFLRSLAYHAVIQPLMRDKISEEERLQRVMSPAFDHAVHCFMAFKSLDFRMAGGFGKAKIHEWQALARRIWLLHQSHGNVRGVIFGGAASKTTAETSSRRADYAALEGRSIAEQWDVRAFKNGADPIRLAGVDLADRSIANVKAALAHQVQRTLAVFPLPRDIVPHVATKALHSVGLNDVRESEILLNEWSSDASLATGSVPIAQDHLHLWFLASRLPLQNF